MERLKDVFGKDDISVKPNGILNNLTLHHPNEAARHKLIGRYWRSCINRNASSRKSNCTLNQDTKLIRTLLNRYLL